jgi:phospholipid-binding lipoprotein MlaA
MYRNLIFLGVLSIISTTACAGGPASDPWAGYNHNMFQLNRDVDVAVVEPVAKGYRAAVPEPARDGVHNVLENIKAPTDLVNNVLQGKPEGAFNTVARFGINSTFGIGGLFDPAKRMGIEARPEDFGQTLAVWNVETGPYLVLPFFGPSNVRDTTGMVVDVITHPITFVRYEHGTAVRATRFMVSGLDLRTNSLDLVQNIRENSVDKYAAFRSGYEQYRANAIRDGEIDLDELPDFEEFDEDE